MMFRQFMLIVALLATMLVGCQNRTADGKLSTSEAFDLIEAQLGMPPVGFQEGGDARTRADVEDVTPDGVWEQMGAQVFQVGQDWSVIVTDGRAHALPLRGLTSGVEDAVVTDLDGDGDLEMVIRYAYAFSGVWGEDVLLWWPDEYVVVTDTLLSRFCDSLSLRKRDDQTVEIVVPRSRDESVVGVLAVPDGESLADATVEFESALLPSDGVSGAAIRCPELTGDEAVSLCLRLPDIVERTEYIRNATDGERTVKGMHEGSNDTYHFVQIFEDAPTHIVTMDRFWVDRKTGEVLKVDPLTGKPDGFEDTME